MNLSLLIPAFIAIFSVAFGAEAPPYKQFIGGALTGSKGDTFGYSLCQQDNTLHYLIFTPGVATVNKLGAFEPQIQTSNVQSKHPKATLKKTPHDEEDLFGGQHQLYQIEIGGHVRTYDDRVTLHEFNQFMKSNSDTHTIDALLAYVRDHRATK
jgi:hypothetical protein